VASIPHGVLAIKKNEIMSFVGKWMELGIIMLSKIGQTQKDKYMFLSYVKSKFKKDRHCDS
jgi:hypothetical protein